MKTVSLSPLTRVEGHGRVELQLEDGRLSAVRLAITESPRLFEGLLLGRAGLEAPALVSRICAICSAVHRVAAATALENALGLRIPPTARRVRDLLLLGGHIESHALHLFCLVLPDLAGAESILELLRAGDRQAREGLALKALGNRLQEVAGGRVIHPVNVEVGGVLVMPERRKLEALQAELEEWPDRLPALVEAFGDPRRYPSGTAPVGTRIAVDGSDGFLLTGDVLALSDGRRVPGTQYRQVLVEGPVAYSNAKHSLDNGRPLLAGALARLELAAGRVPELAGSVVDAGIHGNNAAQGAELLWALRKAGQLVGELLAAPAGEALRTEAHPGPGSGTCVVEAPRGLLIHHYVLDGQGRVGAADIVTPTAINQAAIEAQLLADLLGVTDEVELTGRAARIVRAYDPCISCSVHVLKR